MGLFSGPRITAPPAEEARSQITSVRPHGIFPATSSDVVVNSVTAAQSIAIRSTVDLIASMVSELPISVYTETRGQRRKIATPTVLQDPGGDGAGREDWAYRLLWSWLIAGNAFGDVVERDSAGRLRTVDLLSPDAVNAVIVAGKTKWWLGGVPFDDGRMVHWRVNPVPGQLWGLSPIEAHATTIGVSLATSRFGRQWFADGAHPSGLLYNDMADIDGDQAQAAKDRVMLTRGTSEPMVFGKGWKWENVQITPEESQFLETQGLSESQCARIYGPGYAEILGYGTSGSNITYANVVDRRQDLLVFSMNRWIRRYERVLSAFTPRPQWVEVNRDALLEATTLQRYQAHALALNTGWKVPDEVRDIEHLDPLPNGAGKTPIQKTGTPAPTQQEADNESDSGT